MGRKENEKGRYLEEAAIVLAREGFRVEKTPEEKVEVWWEDAPLCEILLDGGIAYQSEDISTPEREVAKDRAYKVVSTVAQYMAQMESAPFLNAVGLEDKYKVLADFNGVVLAGCQTEHGVQFVTWDWSHDREGVCYGHYYTGLYAPGNYDAAKRDFAVRSGLIPKEQVFEKNQLVEIYRCCTDTLQGSFSLTYMASVMSTVLSRLNSFLDSELEQVLCFDSAVDAEKFAEEKSAIFLILPEEDTTKNFMAGLMIQNLSRELFAVADENGGKLKNRVILFCDELGTMPPFDILPLFSAGRSRLLTLVPLIQSMDQLVKNYGKEGASILMDNCQDVICGGFAPNSEAAETFSKALGSRTVLSGSVSRGKNDLSQSLQMMERPLLTADELKSIPKGSFIVQKTGCHPMRTRLRLFLEWGITFEEEYRVKEQSARKVYYADRESLTRAILRKYPPKIAEGQIPRSGKGNGQLHSLPVQDMIVESDAFCEQHPPRRAYNLPKQEDTP